MAPPHVRRASGCEGGGLTGSPTARLAFAEQGERKSPEAFDRGTDDFRPPFFRGEWEGNFAAGGNAFQRWPVDVENRNGWDAIRGFLRGELHDLVTIQRSERSWQMAFAAATSNALPLFAGAYLGELADGVVASLGGFAFLYLPVAPLARRIGVVAACASGLTACYALGLMSQEAPLTQACLLAGIVAVTRMLRRVNAIGPAASLFFVMVSAIGAYTPMATEGMGRLVGLVGLGGAWACVVTLAYGLHARAGGNGRKPAPGASESFRWLAFDAAVVGAGVALSLMAAQALEVERPYWVPVACIAVLQGATLRAMWSRQVHRVIGTSIGLLVTWGLLLLPLDKWSVATLILMLVFIVEMAVVRHYAFAAIFITPMAILLAEAATLGEPVSGTALIRARFLDTCLGTFVGFLGGVALHWSPFRSAAEKLIAEREKNPGFARGPGPGG